MSFMSSFNGSSLLVGYLMPKASCRIKVVVLFNPVLGGDKGVHTFLKARERNSATGVRTRLLQDHSPAS